MNDLLYHPRSPEVYLIVALNAHHRFTSQWTPPFKEDWPIDHLFQIKMKHIVTKNPNSFAKTNLIGKVNNLLLMGNNTSKKIFIKDDNLSKSLRIKYAKTWGVIGGLMCFIHIFA